ncbi:linear amide C-N hydrolase [Kaistia algarum]|uniref:linear amide C-N hydrolase n=1 Tax=Kaistia algarum TaxID=2083279 RepID=UPI000CE803C4|nr:linear amide C-N hydrolase [Kaistia algarum]MCX5512036.1 linear amide C-N hydrolase [Kaistia algarum]PPE80161.1 linear amide C-N hydrolase [Kaistia algarum]
MPRIRSTIAAATATLALLATSLAPADACTRAVYIGSDNTVITGRSMDWLEDMHTRLWAFPRGIKRDGAAGPGSPVWTSKYGSIVASGYDIGTADGMNEAGLVANLLYLTESDYGSTHGKPPLSMALWAQYVLDNFATVADAVTALEKEPFRVQTAKLPNGKAAQLHLSISDATGDSAIFQYIGGKLVIYHGEQYRVMTNSPTYDQQLALNSYWQEIGGLTFLPGTNRAADRFARADFLIHAIPTKIAPTYISAVPNQSFDNQAVASVMGVMRSVSVPLGITTPGQPNISSTIWRTVADQKNKVYFFDSSTSPNTFWVPLADLDLKEGAPVMMLDITGGKVFAGNAADKFVETKPFTFMEVVPTQ